MTGKTRDNRRGFNGKLSLITRHTVGGIGSCYYINPTIKGRDIVNNQFRFSLILKCDTIKFPLISNWFRSSHSHLKYRLAAY